MNLLPKTSGMRPRLACEISPEGVVAGRATEMAGPVEEMARVALREGSIAPGLRPGNLVDRVAVVSAIRRALESIGVKPNSRGADLTVVIPDGAVRVLLLDFDALPGKLTEALPIVRFRLKKLVPFDADEAMISFQVMSSSKAGVRVLAATLPRDVLSEYETAVWEAGYEAGAVLPSTLALLPLAPGQGSSLLVNGSSAGITTAIVNDGVLLLHRSIDLQPTAMENHTGMVAGPSEATLAAQRFPASPELGNSPYLSPTLQADLNAEIHNAILVAPTSPGTLTEANATQQVPEMARAAVHEPAVEKVTNSMGYEIAQAVSVAAAYFEDTLFSAPSTIFSAGLSAEELRRVLLEEGVGGADGLQVRELVDTAALDPGAISASVPRAALAGVTGALRG